MEKFQKLLLFRLFIKETPIETFPIDGYLKKNATLHFAAGLQTIPAPAHSAGQIALLCRSKGASCLPRMQQPI